VSTPEFMFSMKFAGRDQNVAILSEVAANVFQTAGCPSGEVTSLVADLCVAVRQLGSDGHADVDVQFRGGAGSCDVVVRVDDRVLWHASSRVP